MPVEEGPGPAAVPYRWDQCILPHGAGAGPTGEGVSNWLTRPLRHMWDGTEPEVTQKMITYLNSVVDTPSGDNQFSRSPCCRAARTLYTGPLTSIPATVPSSSVYARCLC